MEKLLVIVILPVTITIVTEETLQRVRGTQSREYSDRAVRITAVTYLMSYSWRRHDFLFFCISFCSFATETTIAH